MSQTDNPPSEPDREIKDRAAAYITPSGTPHFIEVTGTTYSLEAALLNEGARFLPSARGFIDESGLPYIVGKSPEARSALEQHLRDKS